MNAVSPLSPCPSNSQAIQVYVLWGKGWYLSPYQSSGVWQNALYIVGEYVVQWLSHVWLFVIPWTAARQAPLSFTVAWSLLKLMCIELVMPSIHLILCHPFCFCLQSFPAPGSFPVSQPLVSGGQSIGASALASVLPMTIEVNMYLEVINDWIKGFKDFFSFYSNYLGERHQLLSCTEESLYESLQLSPAILCPEMLKY